MAEANQVLYAACGIESDNPPAGGLFRRVDGEKPRWELIWRWPHVIREKGDETEIMRGLTAIPDPAGGGYDVLLGTRAFPGVIERIEHNQPERFASLIGIQRVSPYIRTNSRCVSCDHVFPLRDRLGSLG